MSQSTGIKKSSSGTFLVKYDDDEKEKCSQSSDLSMMRSNSLTSITFIPSDKEKGKVKKSGLHLNEHSA